MTDIIREFFHDGIYRVLPGGVVIFLYAWLQVIGAVSGSHEHAILMIFCALAAAWIVGVILGIITFDIPMLALKCLEKWLDCKWYEALQARLSYKEYIRDDSPSGRRLQKIDTEKVFFRHMFAISLFTLACPPAFTAPFEWQWWYSLVGIIVFFSAWIFSFLNPQKNNP